MPKSLLRAEFIRQGLIRPNDALPTNLVKAADGNWSIVPDFVKA